MFRQQLGFRVRPNLAPYIVVSWAKVVAIQLATGVPAGERICRCCPNRVLCVLEHRVQRKIVRIDVFMYIIIDVDAVNIQ